MARRRKRAKIAVAGLRPARNQRYAHRLASLRLTPRLHCAVIHAKRREPQQYQRHAGKVGRGGQPLHDGPGGDQRQQRNAH